MGKKKVSPALNITHKVQDLLKEIVKAPPEPLKQEEVEETTEPETQIERHETVQEEPDPEELEEQSWKEERERRRDIAREEILSNLNHATEQWKETGDVGIHLEPPVPFSEKIRKLLGKMRANQQILTGKLQVQLSNARSVQQSIAQNLKQVINAKLEERRVAKEHARLIAEQAKIESIHQKQAPELIDPQLPQTPQRIQQPIPTPPRPAVQTTPVTPITRADHTTIEKEWQEVVQKLSPSEREEIERMLDQLSNR